MLCCNQSYAGELNTRIKVQLNASIFSKTLRKKDISSGASSSAIATEEDQSSVPGQSSNQKKEEDEDSFKSKAQVIQLSSVDANRVSMFSMHYFALVMFPCELLIGGTFIYKILGISALVGIAVSIVTAPLTSWVAKQQGGIQKKLQVARDKRVSVLNEAFGAIRMIKVSLDFERDLFLPPNRSVSLSFLPLPSLPLGSRKFRKRCSNSEGRNCSIRD